MTVETTLFRLAFRQLTASRRALWALLLAAVPLLLALVSRAQDLTREQALEVYANTYQVLIVGVLLPLVALVVGTSVFGAETEDGTILYVLGKPVERWRMVLARLAAAAVAVALVMVPTTLATALVTVGTGDESGLVLGSTLSVAAGALLYSAVFIALSLSTRRALVVGLAYVVIWEGTFSNIFAGTRALSVRQYTLSVADGLSALPDSILAAGIPGETAIVMGAVVAVLATVHAVRRLRVFEVGEAA